MVDLQQCERDSVRREDDLAISVVTVSFRVDKLHQMLSVHSERRLHAVVHLHARYTDLLVRQTVSGSFS